MSTTPADDPRTVRSREAIIAAVLAILEEDGPGGITHLRVAERAGVGRATVYRHWPQPADLLREVIGLVPMPFLDQPAPTLREQLRMALRRMRNDFGLPIMQAVLVTQIDRSLRDAAGDVMRRQHLSVLAARMAEQLGEALASGELVGAPDADELLSRLIGPVFFRVVVQQTAATDDYLERLLDETLAPFTP